MATAEDKLELLVKEVKHLQEGQLKLTTTMDTISKWSIEADKFSIELGKSVADLTSCMKAFEVATSAPSPPAPERKEEGRAKGHRVDVHYQDADGQGSTLHHTLVKVEHYEPKSSPLIVDAPETSARTRSTTPYHSSGDYKLPKVDFPRFEGDHPRVWKEKCEKYFYMYQVPVHLWIPMATINFYGNASLWLQTYEAQHNIDSWPELCAAVESKFGRELYQNYMR